MAWDDVALQLTSPFTVTTGGATPNQFVSRWVRSLQDPVDRSILHIVREIQGDQVVPRDEVGFYYMRYNINTDTMVRHVAVESETAAAGDGNLRAPRVAHDVVQNRLWAVYTWKVGTSSHDDHHDTGPILAKYSDDDGASWSSRITISSASLYRYPSISFGADGTGLIVMWDVTNDKWVYTFFAGGDTWDTVADLHTPTAAAMQIGMSDVAVAHNGTAVALIDSPLGTGSPRPSYMYWNGTVWGGPNVIESPSSASTGMTEPWIEYHTNKLEYQLIFGYSDGSPNSQRYTLSRNGVLGNSTDLLFGSSVNGSNHNAWISACMDEAANVHILYNAGSSGDASYKMWTRSNNTLSAATGFDYITQVTDHAASTEPLAATSGAIGVTNPVGRIVFTGDQTNSPSQYDDYYPWTAEDPTLIDLPPIDTQALFGKIVRIRDIETTSGSTQDRKLAIYVGNAIYHDGNLQNFTGNLVGTGQFEPAVSDMEVFQNEVYISDGGVTTLQKWDGADGTSAVTVTNDWAGNTENEPAPKLVGCVEAADRLWGWTLDEPRRILGSGLKDGNAWTLTQATLDEDDPVFIFMEGLPRGEPIQGIGVFYGDRIVFSRTGILRITGTTPYLGLSADTNAKPFTTEPITSDVGAESHLSIVDVGKDLFFVSAKGVHSLATTDKYGDQEAAYLSAAIQDVFDTIEPSFLPKMQGVNYRAKNQAIWTASITGDGGEPRTLLMYDYAQQNWAIWKYDFNIWSLHTRKTPDQKREQLLAGTNEGYVVLLDQASRYDHFKDTNYDAKVTSAYLHGGVPRSYKKFGRILIHFREPSVGTITGRWWVDDGQPTTFTIDGNPDDQLVIGSPGMIIGDPNFIIGGTGATAPPIFTQRINQWGKQLVVEFTTSAGASAIAGVEVEYIPGTSHRAVN